MRRPIKTLARTIATAAILPAVALYRLGALASSPERVLPGWSQGMALLPGVRGTYVRHAFHRRVLSACSQDVSIGFGTPFSHTGASLGHGVYTGTYCLIGGVRPSDDVLLASNVSATNCGRRHRIVRLDVPIRHRPRVRASAHL